VGAEMLDPAICFWLGIVCGIFFSMVFWAFCLWDVTEKKTMSRQKVHESYVQENRNTLK
jgi:hypothetical protein